MKHICFIFCLLFTMSFNAVKETSAFDNESFQNEVGNRLPGILDKHTYDKALGFIKKLQFDKALPHIKYLAKRNNAWSLNALGTFYKYGYAVPKNYKTSYIFFKKAVELNFTQAFYNLATMYQLGLGTEVNYDKALLLLKTAANNNHVLSQTNIGFIYRKGLGVTKDYKEAIRWYKLAAINGDNVAQSELGSFYEKGYGTSKNYIEAKRWYALSADQGDKVSIDGLKRINNLIREQSLTTDNNNFSLKPLDGFSDFRTMTVKRGKKIFNTYAAIKEDQIGGNWITEGKVIIDNEICSSNSTYNEKTNAGVLLVECPSGYNATGKVIPLGTNKGSRGEGTDSFGNNFQFNFHSKSRGKAKKEDMIAFFEEQKNIIETAVTSSTRGFIEKKKLEKNLRKSNNFYALVISIKDYKHLNNLKTPLRDGKKIGSILEKKYGFKVDYLSNATHEDITKKLSNLVYSLKENDNFLIYFAGHGKEVLDDGYWLPHDAEEKIDTKWISNDYIGKKLKQIKSKNILVIADSCYSGTLTRSDAKSVNKKTKPIDKWLNTKSRIVISSGGVGPVHDSGGGGHSVFARFVINFLTNNSEAITATDLHASIYKDVSNLSLKMGTQQTPRIGQLEQFGHEGPDFVFLSN